MVVDDHPDAARLLGKLFRRAGYEVAEVADHHLALTTLVDEGAPAPAVIGSFSTAGTGASLRLLDAIRNHHENTVNELRFLLISDHPRKRIFCFQAGADAILLRPFDSEELLATTAEMTARPEGERIAYRRQQIQSLKADPDGAAVPASSLSPTVTF